MTDFKPGDVVVPLAWKSYKSIDKYHPCIVLFNDYGRLALKQKYDPKSYVHKNRIGGGSTDGTWYYPGTRFSQSGFELYEDQNYMKEETEMERNKNYILVVNNTNHYLNEGDTLETRLQQILTSQPNAKIYVYKLTEIVEAEKPVLLRTPV